VFQRKLYIHTYIFMFQNIHNVQSTLNAEVLIASIIRVTRIVELGTTANIVPSLPILVTLMMGVICSPET
jgi:hypothetical protein